MGLGPVQVVVIGFDGPEGENGAGSEIRRELQAVRGRGVIRLIDWLFLRKDPWGNLAVVADGEAEEGNARPLGMALRRLAGIDGPASPQTGREEAPEGPEVPDEANFDLPGVLDLLSPGDGVALVLFEHAWATGLAHAVRGAGGRMLAQGFLTRDAVTRTGAELRAIAEAEAVMEVADAVRCVPLLDALSCPPEARHPDAKLAAVASAVAAETLRTLVVAGLIDHAEAEPALMALLDAGLLDPAVVERALEGVEAYHSDVQAEATQGAGTDSRTVRA